MDEPTSQPQPGPIPGEPADATPPPAGPTVGPAPDSSGPVPAGPMASDPAIGSTPDGPAAAQGWVPTGSVQRKSSSSRIVVFAVIAVVVVAAIVGFAVVGSSQTPYEKAATKAGQRLVDDPAFKTKFGDLKDDAAFATGASLVKDGLGRVDDATQLTMLQSTSKVLALADTAACARLSLGTSQPTDVIAIVQRLDDGSMNAYIDAAVTTALAALHGDPKRTAPTDAEQSAAGVAWQAAVGQDAFTTDIDILQHSADHTPAEICTANRKLTDAAILMTDPSRSIIVRLIYAGN